VTEEQRGDVQQIVAKATEPVLLGALSYPSSSPGRNPSAHLSVGFANASY
jgi:hypothetical protein